MIYNRNIFCDTETDIAIYEIIKSQISAAEITRIKKTEIKLENFSQFVNPMPVDWIDFRITNRK